MELKDVVIKAQKGDSKAFAALFEQTQKMVYFTSLKITGDESVAEDLTQEVYLKAMEKLNTLKVPEAFIGWLRQITVNTCKNYLASNKPMALGESENDEMLANLPEVEENFIPHAYADNRETCRLIMAMVDSLPENQRAVVIMYYYNELPVSRIAELLQVSENTVKSRLNYARRQIKEQVEDLEKKGTKLHAVPVLGLVLQRAAEDYTLSAKAAAAITGAIAAQAATTAATTTTAAATTAATGGIFAKIATLPIATKIIAGVLSVGVAVGAGVGVASVVNGEDKRSKISRDEEDEISELGGKFVEGETAKVDDEIVIKTAGEELASLDDIEEMLGLTKNQIFAKWGETFYDDEDARVQYVFEDEAVSICFVGGVADEIILHSFDSVFGLNQNMTADEMLAHLNTAEEIVHMEEYNAALKHFNVYTKNARYHIWVDNYDMFESCRIYRGGYEEPEVIYAFISDISVGNGVKDKSHIPFIKAYSDGSCIFKLNNYNGMQILEGTYESFVANGTTTYTFDMKASDYMEGGRFNLVHESGLDKATFYAIGNSYFGTIYTGDLFKVYLDNAEEAIEEFEASIAENQAVQSTLISYWENNLKGDGGWYAFADVTHDGKDELFNLVKKYDSDYDADYAYFGVYALINGEVVKIDNGGFTQNPSVFEYYHLYYENEKAYIMYRYYTGRQGGISSFYHIYSFDSNGQKVMLRSEDISGLEENFTSADYDKVETIEENYQEYREKSSIIIDVVYGVLNVGGWW